MTGIKDDGSIFISEFLDEFAACLPNAAGAVKDISIYINDDDCCMDIRLRAPIETTILEQEYPNAQMLSADLRDNLGLGPAMDLLEKNGIPRTHPLWDLNHSGLWER